MNTLIDTHCHLDFSDFDADRQEVIRRCQQQNISGIIIPCVSRDNWQNAIVLCEQQSICHLALGLHPQFIAQHQPQHLLALSSHVQQYNPIAVGEIGLDFYHKNADKEKQIAYFDKQVIIAQEHQLPIIVHCRKAHHIAITRLRDIGFTHGGIIHAFNGAIDQAKMYIDMGFKLGIGGRVTYPHSRKIRQLAKTLPLTDIVLETDAPDMVISQYPRQRNSPEYLPIIAQVISDIRQCSLSEVTQITTNNVFTLFPRLTIS